jgi:hypothetical protein
MPNFHRIRSLIIAGYIIGLLAGCERVAPVDAPFVKATYSEPTTEIVDHILLDMVGTDVFYEGWWEYQNRTGNHAPVGADTATQQAFVWRYRRERKLQPGDAMFVVWPRLSAFSIAPKRRQLGRRHYNIAVEPAGGKPEEYRMRPPRLRFDSVDNQLYHLLLDSMRNVRLRVAEMKNTGRYTLITPTSGPWGQSYWPPYDWESSKGKSLLVGHLSVSEAVFDRSGNRACLLLERYAGHNSSYAEFLFVERQRGRWKLTKTLPFWQS